ncbi:UDP-N-acetylglucosamine 1-carboxyvinyltransferase [Bartonella bacilliformis str. Heidi Mejia]|uniref:UDP-N-acetylglucosamine 1-carboxyvinyltransferase n=2 Tax=Bartonella bacilliformis TaxID=774 RepID=A1URD4_BARBK|nr:UDP-N-acetylglucosamine 1-carboxyvinyltransferase [Bartonella bacilliformis]ABM45225.1 UDP-N-acetylglucosamine 1-carboxyvinyltransferase [Bartonella bacilliformis KC583]AMG85408.1 UDP-N-acetylglucosamine 1-carboxyvinyltransferase [Bartonella bacilliformis]EKS46086.1 UDP-N-acetylglucosamine 1-carboxyvinyltransferase [Bartonella bacilliformis INS]EYS89155.1 UDP-N-acetylglucosamine 1-carboxyvinyltransferase [Bartonella bacilliformis San Pedro600-02]EYS91375.1 UDP-N-acetylglucosamine 1-carboxyv
MDSIKITGGNILNGVIPISGAKNAALPLMIAALLTDETLIVDNVPHLADVECLIRILNNHGIGYAVEGRQCHTVCSDARTIYFTAKNITTIRAPYELVRKMRASFWVIGPLLARCQEACVSLPGGCAIGTRPVDFILEGLKALGADIAIENGYVHAKALKGLKGASYHFPKVTVGGTHVLLMAAVLAEGKTVLHNAACEPEVTNLVQALKAMGADISGEGTDVLTIHGVKKLHGARVCVIPDRIEAGTYAMAVAMTGGDVLLQDAVPEHLTEVLTVLEKAGLSIEIKAEGIRVFRDPHKKMKSVDITTAPFPAFPTDLQAQFMALMTLAEGNTHITETIFENRFMHVQELVRLGARITLQGKTATVHGTDKLQGAQVMATDLRASVSLVIAALAAEGETTVNRVYHLDRGFERLEEKLAQCGACIQRVTTS